MNKKKEIFASIFGNALEFYDFTLYGVFAKVFADLFFPNHSLIASWGAFAAGFLMRPVGGIFFGYIGDKFGRKKALMFSLMLMGLPTFIIGVLPSYYTIGIFAPIILVLCRLLQGICTGGEYNGAAIFALEHVKKKSPGLIGGLITGSCVIGALAATGLGSLVTAKNMPEWGWRIPFICGSFISIAGVMLRRKISETPEFKSIKINLNKSPLLQTLINHKQAFLTTAVLGGLNGALSYTLFGFLNVYLSQYTNLTLVEAMKLNLIGLLSFMLFCPIMGHILDKVKSKVFFLTACITIITASGPVFFLLQSNNIISILIGQISLGILVASIAGPSHAFIQTLFPVEDRYSGLSFSFCIGMALWGGTTPMLLTYLLKETQILLVPAIVLGTYSAICFIIISLHKEKEEILIKQSSMLST